MDDDVALPRATLLKIIKDSMPAQMRVSSELADLLIECCTEFVHMVYSQANDVSTAEKRSTILPDHITKALEQLDFSEWVPEVRKTWDEHKASTKSTLSIPSELHLHRWRSHCPGKGHAQNGGSVLRQRAASV